MKKKPNPALIDTENPEWTKEMFARAKPASEVFPDLVEHSKNVNRLRKKSTAPRPRR